MAVVEVKCEVAKTATAMGVHDVRVTKSKRQNEQNVSFDGAKRGGHVENARRRPIRHDNSQNAADDAKMKRKRTQLVGMQSTVKQDVRRPGGKTNGKRVGRGGAGTQLWRCSLSNHGESRAQANTYNNASQTCTTASVMTQQGHVIDELTGT